MSKPTFLGPLMGKGVGQCEMVCAERGSVLARRVEPAFDSKTRKRGLLGRDSIPADYAMIIAPCSAIHTFRMRVPIDVVFVSRNGTITRTCRGVKPWRIAGSMKAFAAIEAAEGFIDRHELVPGEIVAMREIANSGRAPWPSVISASQLAGEADATPARRTTHNRVTLADIVAVEPLLAWFEAVAIVQELCKTVIARGPADDLRVPELEHITLTADGGVMLLADGPSGHSPVQRTGLVLLALTPEGHLPPPLRLLVLEVVSPRPKLNALKDLHRELEFFERPDRQLVVRGVHDRFRHGPVAAASRQAVPPQPLELPPTRHRHHWWRRRSVRAGSVTVLTVFAIALALWAWPRPEGQWLRTNAGQLSKVSMETGRKAFRAAQKTVESATSKLGFRRREPDRSGLARQDAGLPRSPELGQNVTLQGGASPPQIQAFELTKTTVGDAAGPAATNTVSRAETHGIETNPGPIFSAADRGVEPPVFSGLRPPWQVPAGVRVQEPPEYDIVVSATGLVESVKLISSRPGVRAGMELSVIKAWRFEPATLGGQPVRYRLRVRLPAQ